MLDLKEMRIKAELTQKEVAESLCVSQQAVQQWEEYKSMPQADRLIPLMRALGISFLDLYDLLKVYAGTIKDEISYGEAVDCDGFRYYPISNYCSWCERFPSNCTSDCIISKYLTQEAKDEMHRAASNKARFKSDEDENEEANEFMRQFEEGLKSQKGAISMGSPYPDWVEERFGDDIPDWAEERWGDDDDDDD